MTAPPGLIMVVGPNGAGKTNILEAVFFLSVLKSFRTNRDADLIRDAAPAFILDAAASGRRGDYNLKLTYDGRGKRAAVNGEDYPRLLDYVGTLAAVAFTPEDIGLARGDPAGRRRFLDIWLGQQSREYLYDLGRYADVLRRRNVLLQTGAPPAQREPYDEELVRAGTALTVARAAAVKALAGEAADAYAGLAPAGEALTTAYVPSVPPGKDREETQEAFRALVAAARADEERRKVSLVGPHRDDVAIAINGGEARRFASEGQLRTCALALRLAQFRLLKAALGEAPIMLLDDVGAELDEDRRGRLEAFVRDAEQVWFAAPSIPPAVAPALTIRVDGGQLHTS